MSKVSLGAVATYLKTVELSLRAGNSTEHTHRPALQKLVESVREKIVATNEPKRIACGSPDYIVTRTGVPVGYIEAKDVGVDLDRAEKSEQITRYRESLRNLVLTDYLQFRLFRNGEVVQAVRIAERLPTGLLRPEVGADQQLVRLLDDFLDADLPSIASPRELAERMARMTRLLNELIRKAFETESPKGDLHAQYDAFKRVIITDLSTDAFADMYAQTIAYGLFAARCNHVGPSFTRDRAGHDMPKTNPFLRRLFNTIAGPDLDERISWAVDDLAELLAKADMDVILKDFGRVTLRTDPVVHFYETFLAAYNPKLREVRGVYYTPESVVSYIVRSVDALLIRDFGLPTGLADSSRITLKRKKVRGKGEETYEAHRVQILDPACGTGTFLSASISHIHERFLGNAGLWPSYVAEHLLPRVYGFELLMAPYAVAHMKLGLQLKESGYDFRTDERLRVYLTNTLEEAHEMTGLPLFTQWLAEEAAAAGEVKTSAPIMVVIGNPPYSGHSANKGEWIGGLMNDYKKSAELKKRGQAKWLSDDYVKFIRFAQWRIEQTGHGILAFVTNHSYLSNPTFLDMRASLMADFDEIYVLDLHGSSKPKEVSPAGENDKNVFDIQKGVAVTILVRRSRRSKSCTVYRADLWGSRHQKYAWLSANDVLSTPWEQVTPARAPWYFIKQDAAMMAEYEKGWSIADVFKPHGDPAPGVVTTHDPFAISWDREEAVEKVERLLASADEAEARRMFRLCTQDQWSYARAKEELRDGLWREKVTPILYRPFDIRWTIWDSNVAVHRRERVMRHMLAGGNLALVTNRQVNGAFCHAFVSELVINDCALSTASKERSYLFPLHIRETDVASHILFDDDTSQHGISDSFLEALGDRLDGVRPSPEDAFSYIYAILNAPTYRVRYEELLRKDFPRIPLVGDCDQFSRLVKHGKRLTELHLLRNVPLSFINFPVAGSNRIEKVEFVVGPHKEKGRVFINNLQYFDEVPEPVWAYYVGGYKVAEKWLKDRKGRSLTFDEMQQYGSVIAALDETIRIQGQLALDLNDWPMG